MIFVIIPNQSKIGSYCKSSQESEIDIDSDYIDVNCILKAQMCQKSKVLNLTL